MVKGENERQDGMRLDKWLWVARFFKTRALAREAVDGGKVDVNGVRAKPSREVCVGQEIRMTTPRGQMTIVVQGIGTQRGSATVASALYFETEESLAARAALHELHRLSHVAAPEGRPSSQARKMLRQIKEG